MNPNEALKIAEIVVGSAAGLAALYFGIRSFIHKKTNIIDEPLVTKQVENSITGESYLSIIGTRDRITSDELMEVGLGKKIKGTDTASEATRQALQGKSAIINRRRPQ